MSAGAVIFMLLTMGGVLAVNVLCIVLWLRAPKPAAAPPGAERPAAEPPVAKPPVAEPPVAKPPAGSAAEPPAP
jgi:hypothetical protein